MSSNWSDAQRAEIERRLGAGESPTDIARLMGLRRESIRQHGVKQQQAHLTQQAHYQPNKVRAASSRENARTPVGKPKYRGVPWGWQQSRETLPNGIQQADERVYTVLAFSDSHDKPRRCKERFRWFGKHTMSKKFDAVVALGDTASIDSLSGHDEPGSQGDIEKPYFWEDLSSLDEALSLFHSECPIGHIPIYHPHGNHENRSVTAAKKQPKLNGDMPVRLDEVFARYRWQTFPYGKILDLFGVQWVHTILNKMGRPSNGEFPEQLHGKKQVKDLVLAHTHTHNVVTVGKNSERVKVVNLGCSMPWGVREKYTPDTSPPWDYGICEIRIKDSKIISTKYIDLLELEEMYGG